MRLEGTDFTKLLENVSKGAWVAVAHDEPKVVAYADSLNEVLEKAKDAGEPRPVVLRRPIHKGFMVL